MSGEAINLTYSQRQPSYLPSEEVIRTVHLNKIFTRYTFRKSVNVHGPSGFFMDLYYRYSHSSKERITVIDDVNVSIRKGEIVCILGPNGSGKTTLLKILAGILKPSSGKIYLNGRDLSIFPDLVSRYVSFIPGMLSGGVWINSNLTGRQNLQYYARLFGLDPTPIDEILEMVGLGEATNARAGTYSPGMFARIVLGAALMKPAPLLLMDEPAIGLSREVVLDVLSYIKRISKERGATVVYATNVIEEAERIADTIIVLKDGHVVASDNMDNLIASVKQGEVIEIEASDVMDDVLLGTLKKRSSDAFFSPRQGEETAGTFRIYVQEARKALAMVVADCMSSDVKIDSIKLHSNTLEDAYVRLIQYRV